MKSKTQNRGAARLASLRKMMVNNQLDGLVFRLNHHVVMVSEYWPINGLSLVVLPLEGDPILVAPIHDERFARSCSIRDIRYYRWGDLEHGDPLPVTVKELRGICDEFHLAGKRLGMELDYPLSALPAWTPEMRQWTQSALQEIRSAFSGATFVDTWKMLGVEASHKTAEEVAKIRVANQVGGLALKTFRENVKAGRSEFEIAAAVEHAVHARGPTEFGVGYAKAWAAVMSGPNSQYAGQTYNISTSRIVEKGDLVSLEMGVVADGYWTDLTRVHVAGKPSARQQELFGWVTQAHDAAAAAVRIGVPWKEVDRAARQVIVDAKHGKYFHHHTGHGLGFCYHEIHPVIAPTTEALVEEGQMVTIEPAVYSPEWGGIRHEDVHLVTAKGSENLSPFYRGLETA